MSSLVARLAANVHWLGRYLERAENLARILHINETYARDDAAGPDWRRVLDLYDDAERFDTAHGTPTGPAVVAFYLVDRKNQSSIANAIHSARENARSVRHLISTEMWTQINVFHANVAELKKRDATVTNLSRVCGDVVAGCQSFEGVTAGTFLRGEPWCFYQLGKYIERADQTTRALDMGYRRLTPPGGDAVAWVHWNVLLRSVCGYHAYRARHPGQSSPHDIATFLLYDVEFPRAVALCINRLTTYLRDIERRHGGRRGTALEIERRQLEFLIDTGPGRNLTPQTLHHYLDRLQTALARVSAAIAATYFSGE